MFVWAPIPEPYRGLGSLEFATRLLREAGVATSPGIGFGPGGDGYVRFALVENEQRIGQALRGIRGMLQRDQRTTNDESPSGSSSITSTAATVAPRGPSQQ